MKSFLMVMVGGGIFYQTLDLHAAKQKRPRNQQEQVGRIVTQGERSNENTAATVQSSSGNNDSDLVEEVETVEEVKTIASKTGGDSNYGDPGFPVYERALNVLTARTTPKGDFTAIVTHRTAQRLLENPIHDYFGFDAGSMKIGLGLRYGVRDKLDVGIYRLNNGTEQFDTYEIDGRFQLTEQSRLGLDMALRGGVSVFVQEDRQDASGFFLQGLGNYVYKSKYLFGGGVGFHSDSSNPAKSPQDTNFTTGLLGYAEARLVDWFAVDFELGMKLLGYGAKWPTISTGIKIFTNRHTFAFVMSNTQMMAADGIISNTATNFDDWILGFNITREI